MAIRIAGPDRDDGRAPASRAIAQASGAAIAPMSANGSADAHGDGPEHGE